ncbi:MAG: hypothetical protein HY304_07615 [candidate division Zixibacteria bacterium]|nr:hypothetical protein [candidate division Zixibacteria bacterium]
MKYKLGNWWGRHSCLPFTLGVIRHSATSTAAATTVVHNPFLSPVADWVTLRVV